MRCMDPRYQQYQSLRFHPDGPEFAPPQRASACEADCRSFLTSSAKSRFESTRRGHTTPGSGPIEGRFFRTGEHMKMIAIVLSFAVSSFAVSAAFAPAWAAGSCKSWLATCNSRTGGSPSSCSAKYSDCLQSGCFTEGKRYGGGTHCGLKK